MIKKLLLGAMLLSTTCAVAQTNFRPGYVVPLTGDTLRGEVDARGAQRNARLARFRPAPQQTITEYQPYQLRGYGFIGDRVYQTRTVLLSDSIRQVVSQSDRAADTVKYPRPSFLEVVVQGAAALLYLRDGNGDDHYYLQMQGKDVQELVRTTRRVVVNGRTYYQRSDEFRYTLSAAMQQCQEVQPSISRLYYGLNDIANVVRRFNSCVGGSSVSPASSSRQTRVILGLTVGGQRGGLRLKDALLGIDGKVSSEVSPVVGLSTTFRFAGVSKTMTARLEALYENQRFAMDKLPSSTLENTEYQMRFAVSTIRIPLVIRYTYPKGSVRPFANIGYSISYFVKAENEIRSRSTKGSTPGPYTEWRTLIEPRQIEQGLLFGVGMTTARPDKRNLAVELRYERSDSFSAGVYIKSVMYHPSLLLSYDLTK